jgi:hypothetical protein
MWLMLYLFVGLCTSVTENLSIVSTSTWSLDVVNTHTHTYIHHCDNYEMNLWNYLYPSTPSFLILLKSLYIFPILA